MFRFTLSDVLWLMVVVACNGLRADEPGPTLKELLRQSTDKGSPEQFDSPAVAVQWQMRRHAGPRLGVRQYSLQISWFRGNGRTTLTYSVTESGFCSNSRYVYNHAVQDSQETQLSDGELKSLRDLMQKLPESKAEPPIERTVHVSFQAGDKWQTETYDASALPNEFEKVMSIIGERFETKDRHKKK